MIAAAEVAPISSHSGLGRATAGLAAALTEEFDVTLVTRRGAADPERFALARRLQPLDVAGRELTVYDGTLPCGRSHVFVVDAGDDSDLLCRAALQIAIDYRRWPDVVQMQDWRTAGVLARFAGEAGDRPPPAAVATVRQTDEGTDALRAAVAAADRVIAPSPSYARELDGLPELAAAAGKLRGILDGIDVHDWDPRRDPALPAHFGPGERAGKAVCKRELQREVGLPRRPRAPLVAATDPTQLLAVAGELGALETIQFVTCGDDPDLLALATRYPTRVAAHADGDRAFTRRLIAGADFELLPDRFDPRAPNKLACLRYGAIPILSPASGLTDTVIDFDAHTQTGSGFVCDSADPGSRVRALARAARVYETDGMDALVTRALSFDVSWETTARQYANVYRELTARR